MTAAAVAVVEVFSEASIERTVERIEVPASLMSTYNGAPVGAVFTLARTSVTVKA